MSRDHMKRKTIRLTDPQIVELEAAVDRGEYPNESEAIRAAVREKFQEDDVEPSPVVVESGNGQVGRVRR